MGTTYRCQHNHDHPAPDPAPTYQPASEVPDVIIVDVDGTVARRVVLEDGTMRCPFGTELMMTDEPKQGVIDHLKLLSNPYTGPMLVFMTGRYEGAREDTTLWLMYYFDRAIDHLYMREEGNQEPDVALKRRLYETHIKGQYRVLSVFDDRKAVTKMWRDEFGLLVFQVAEGDF